MWGLLSAGTLRAVAWMLRLVAGEATFDPAESLIGLRGFEVRVAPVCSGVDGIGLVVLFQAVWISLARSRIRLRRALLLLPLGAIAALVANVLRIATMILVGASGWDGLAMGGLHSKLGWLLFTSIALGSVALAENLPWLRRPAAAIAEEEEEVPRAAVAHLAPLLGALAAALLTGIWSEGAVDTGYGLRIVVALVLLYLVRGALPRPSLSWSWVPVLLAAATCAIWVSWVDGDRRALADGIGRMAPAARWTWIAIRATGSVLVVPVVEELAFRGFLLPWLVSPRFESVAPRAWTWSAVLLSSLAFGALHEHWVLGTVAGLAFAVARLHRGRLGDAILAHALCNGGVAAAVLLAGRWDLWA